LAQADQNTQGSQGMAIQFIISMVQFNLPEWLEVNFTFNMRQKGRITSIPNNSYKNVKGEAGNLYSRYP